MMLLSHDLKNWRTGRADEWKMDEFIRRAKQMEKALNDLITEYCDRDGEEDTPVDDQSCSLIKAAIEALE